MSRLLLGPTTNRPLGLENKAKEIIVGGCEGEVFYLEPTEKRPAVVYADSRMMTAIALSCLRAEGVSEERAKELAVRALEAVYHGGNPELEKFGIKSPAMILPAEERNGAKIAHALSHVRGGSENEARAEEQAYLSRQPGAIAYALPPIDRNDYPNPEASPAAEGKIISFSLGVGGVGGAGYPYWGRPVQPPSTPPAGQSRVPGRGESEFARMLRESAETRLEEGAALLGKRTTEPSVEDRLRARDKELAEEMAEFMRRMFPPQVPPPAQFRPLPPDPSAKSGGISLGEASMGGDATGGQRNRGGGQQQQDQERGKDGEKKKGS